MPIEESRLPIEEERTIKKTERGIFAALGFLMKEFGKILGMHDRMPF